LGIRKIPCARQGIYKYTFPHAFNIIPIYRLASFSLKALLYMRRVYHNALGQEVGAIIRHLSIVARTYLLTEAALLLRRSAATGHRSIDYIQKVTSVKDRGKEQNVRSCTEFPSRSVFTIKEVRMLQKSPDLSPTQYRFRKRRRGCLLCHSVWNNRNLEDL